jgi:hypothetical protein
LARYFKSGKSLPHSQNPSYFVPEEFFAMGNKKTPNLTLNTIIKAPQL